MCWPRQNAALSPLRPALCADALADKLPPAPGSGCRPARAPKITAGMGGPASVISPAVHDDDDPGMMVPAGLPAARPRCPLDPYYARRVGSTPFRYQSPEEDSARWLGFPFRDGDIVISTRSKTGT